MSGSEVRKGERGVHPEDYQNKLSLAAEEAVSLDRNYILAICGTRDPEFRIAAALSDYSCAVYSIGETLCRIATLRYGQAPVVSVKFSPTDHNLLYSASANGYITAWDLRAEEKIVAQFVDDAEGDRKIKTLASFDVSSDERLLAGGTELTEGDAFILFWDNRYNSKSAGRKSPVGGYWESHTDDITALAFHPGKRDVLVSGSTDGLINIFDLAQPTEDSALMHTLNTESSVDKLGWLGEKNLWCGTHTHSLQLWDCQEVAPYSTFHRRSLATSQGEDPENCYLVRMHTHSRTGMHFLLAGSGNEQGRFLRCLNVRGNDLETWCNLSNNKQIVRDSWYHEKSGCLVTGGESGIMSVWRETEDTMNRSDSQSRSSTRINNMRARQRPHETKPY